MKVSTFVDIYMKDHFNPQDSTVLIGSRLHILPHEVVSLKSDLNYTHIALQTGQQYLISYTLKKVADRLRLHAPLFRVNRSTVINLDYLKSFDGHFVLLKNKRKHKVSRRRKGGLEQTLEDNTRFKRKATETK